MKKTLILASKSERRKEILTLCGYDFKIIEANINEEEYITENIEESILNIAKAKALKVYKDNYIVVAADTVVVFDNKIIGKPKNEEDAKHILKKLSNKTHKVITATVIVSDNKLYENLSINKVKFNKITNEEINEYIKTLEPMDKAGAYGIQGKGGCFINKINGDFYSIMGMPLNFVYKILKEIYN